MFDVNQTFGIVILLAVVAGVGYFFYTNHKAKKPAPNAGTNLGAKPAPKEDGL